jgi:hypothetical protein
MPATAEGDRQVTDDERDRTNSLADRARSALSNVGQSERVKQAAARTKDAAARAQEASRNVTRKVGQEDAWDELRTDVELLTELLRAHHALITDLIDRVAAVEARTGPEAGHGD